VRSPRQIRTAGIALLAVLGAAAAAGPGRALVLERSRLANRQEAAWAELKEQDAVENQLQLARQEVDGLRAEIERVHRSLPERLDLDDFLSEIHDLARATDTDLLRVAPGSTYPGDIVSRVTIEIEARATFENLYGFVSRLHRMARLNQVESLKITRDPAAETCDARISLSIFVSGKIEGKNRRTP
jgi:Tfp pilus assembly protein PilO